MLRFFKKWRLQKSVLVKLGIKDSRSLAALHARCFPRGWDAAEFESLLAQSSIICFGIRLGSRLVAFLLLRNAADEVEVLTIAASPSFRRCGLAEQVMRHGMAHAKSAGVKKCHLEVEAANAPALRLYTKLGFQETGRRRGYYVSSGDADAVIMTAAL